MSILFGLFRRPAPAAYACKVGAGIVHPIGSWHEQQIDDAKQVTFATLQDALAEGKRLCQSCPKTA